MIHDRVRSQDPSRQPELSTAPRLSRHMHMMIAAEYVMTYWNDVVKRAGCGKENHDKSQRENDRSVVYLHQCIDCAHILTPGWPTIHMRHPVVAHHPELPLHAPSEGTSGRRRGKWMLSVNLGAVRYAN